MHDKKRWILTSIFLLICLWIVKYHFYGTDISLYPVKNSNHTYSSQKTWLISYASGEVNIKNQSNLLLSAAMYQAFDVIIPYKAHHIEPEYYEKHKEILTQKRGGGYWLWKPYLILKTLNMMPENDILLYLDSASVFRNGIYKLLEQTKENDVILFPNYHLNRPYIKKNLITRIGHESFRDKTQLEANIILLRNTAKARALIEEWLKLCEDPELLTDIPSKNEYPDFIDHRHDQAILTMLYYKSPEKFTLYSPLPARLKSVITHKRRTRTEECSLLPVTFNTDTEFSWLNKIKYCAISWLLGCQIFQGNS